MKATDIKAPAYFFKEPLTIEEAAEFMGLSAGTLYQLAHKKQIPFYKPFGKKNYFKKSELEAFLFRNKTAAEHELSTKADAVLNKERG
jgi:excisionase family DNA binding protein